MPCAATRHGTCDGRTHRLMMAQGTKLRLRRRRDLTGHVRCAHLDGHNTSLGRARPEPTKRTAGYRWWWVAFRMGGAGRGAREPGTRARGNSPCTYRRTQTQTQRSHEGLTAKRKDVSTVVIVLEHRGSAAAGGDQAGPGPRSARLGARMPTRYSRLCFARSSQSLQLASGVHAVNSILPNYR